MIFKEKWGPVRGQSYDKEVVLLPRKLSDFLFICEDVTLSTWKKISKEIDLNSIQVDIDRSIRILNFYKDMIYYDDLPLSLKQPKGGTKLLSILLWQLPDKILVMLYGFDLKVNAYIVGILKHRSKKNG